MPDQDAKADPGTVADPGDGTESQFWAKFNSELDAGIERAVGKFTEKTAASTRNGGRSTLPGILANLMFGPEKK